MKLIVIVDVDTGEPVAVTNDEAAAEDYGSGVMYEQIEFEIPVIPDTLFLVES